MKVTAAEHARMMYVGLIALANDEPNRARHNALMHDAVRWAQRRTEILQLGRTGVCFPGVSVNP